MNKIVVVLQRHFVVPREVLLMKYVFVIRRWPSAPVCPERLDDGCRRLLVPRRVCLIGRDSNTELSRIRSDRVVVPTANAWKSFSRKISERTSLL